ncbi:MAG TPA: hypothetical protein VHT91_05660 [Kofleriaceae bacterium]|jgi:hypothetical protein|nr:hypothetical protein [Kofleriaceae bacterium]
MAMRWSVATTLLAGSLALGFLAPGRARAEPDAPATVASAPKEGSGGGGVVILLIIAGVFVGGYGIGYIIGRSRSFNFENAHGDGRVVDFVAANADKRPVEFRIERSPDGKLGALTPTRVIYSFKVGATKFVYDTADGKPGKVSLSPAERDDSHVARNDLTINAAMGLLKNPVLPAATTAATAVVLYPHQAAAAVPDFTTLLSHGSPLDRLKLVVLGALALLSGCALGFKSGYRDKPDMGTGRPYSLLDSDMFWQSVAHSYGPPRWVFVQISGATLVQVKPDSDESSVHLYLNARQTVLGVERRLQVSAPPKDLVAALEAVGESELLRRLARQVGTYLPLPKLP